jgi:hypothetical protein
MSRRRGVRRAVVAAVLLAVAAPAAGAAAGGSDFTVAQLKYRGGGDWYANPSSLPNLLAALRERTGVRAAERPAAVAPTDDELFLCPFIYMTGHGQVAFSDEEAGRLREYLDRGGFLWADDNYGMDKSFRREIAKLFPGDPLHELPNDHPIYRSFYQLPGLPKIHEHDGLPPQLFGIVHQGRLVVVYSFQSDIGDGLEDADVHKDPPEKREQALRMAVNILMYALTH